MTDWKREFVRVFPLAAARLDEPMAEADEETVEELREIGIELPEELVNFCACLDDGHVIDLEAIGGARQHLHDLYGVLEANHPEEGTFGSFVAQGEVPEGVVLLGYGPTQLLYDLRGALGAAGSFWSTNSMLVDAENARCIAPSFCALLEGATPIEG
jgi:hypothetical protein